MYDFLFLNALYKGQRIDLAVAGSQIAALTPAGGLAQAEARQRIDASDFLLRVPFYNTHTHHAMTLLRGLGEDAPLMEWLTQHIWPREAHLTPQAVYAGTRLAILESIRSGCVAFNDMYFHQPAAIRAAEEMGVRARIGLTMMNMVSEHIENEATLALRDSLPETINLALAPHAPYTTTPELLRQVAADAQRLGLPIHIHLAETLTECAYVKEHFGFDTPAQYLHACGILQPGTLLAHGCHLTESDLALVAEQGCVVIHCPQSNQKLASGIFPFAAAKAAGGRVTIGTDGAASNNGLSMIAETKAAYLQAKLHTPEGLSSPTLKDFDAAATTAGAEALGFTNAGRIAVGADADLLFVNRKNVAFVGKGDPDANFLLAADSSAVDTLLCHGKMLMQNGCIPGEEQILTEAQAAAEELFRD